jgi:hypothetical protein
VTVRVFGVTATEKSGACDVVSQPGNLNAARRVRQLNDPFAGWYWLMYQNVQSSWGSTDIDV